jgi:hypothetical protein
MRKGILGNWLSCQYPTDDLNLFDKGNSDLQEVIYTSPIPILQMKLEVTFYAERKAKGNPGFVKALLHIFPQFI